MSISTVGDCASLIMPPQLGVGIRTPRPRKLSAASRMIALATPNVARTASELMMFGSRWRTQDAPVADAHDACSRDELRLAQVRAAGRARAGRRRASPAVR